MVSLREEQRREGRVGYGEAGRGEEVSELIGKRGNWGEDGEKRIRSRRKI